MHLYPVKTHPEGKRVERTTGKPYQDPCLRRILGKWVDRPVFMQAVRQQFRNRL